MCEMRKMENWDEMECAWICEYPPSHPRYPLLHWNNNEYISRLARLASRPSRPSRPSLKVRGNPARPIQLGSTFEKKSEVDRGESRPSTSSQDPWFVDQLNVIEKSVSAIAIYMFTPYSLVNS